LLEFAEKVLKIVQNRRIILKKLEKIIIELHSKII